MKVAVKTGDLNKTPCDLLVVNLFEGVKTAGRATGAVDKALGGLLSEVMRDEHFEGKESQTLLVHTHGKIPAKRVLVVGLGKQNEFTKEIVRRVTATSLKQARQVSAKRVASLLHGAGVGGLDPEESARAMTEGSLLADYRYLKHKGEEVRKEEEKRSIAEFVIVERDTSKAKKAKRGVELGTIEAEATIYARDLVNEPAAQLTPTKLAEEAKGLADGKLITAKILDRQACEKLGMGAFLGVAKGSDEEPKFIHLSYKPSKPKKKVVLVGKGITFDTGGLSIKSSKNMETMKIDMAGAAAVLAVFRALAKLEAPVEVHGVIAATENMPSGRALKPGDVLRVMNGKTIEVIDTDAEGRLTLADALSYGATLKPHAMIDLATLTGSCIAGLGEEVAGALGNNRELSESVKKAAEASGEMIWELPLVKQYEEAIKSKVADFKNAAGREGDVIKAALLLKEFVGETPWVHLDIAGPAWAEKETIAYIPEGGTGFGVRTLLHYLQSI